jgi:archaellum component FlaF (FlaF/FlaG flagellin family)
MNGAQQNLVMLLQMRRDGIANIGKGIQAARASSTNQDAITAIAAEMARFYASDVLYKDYTLPKIVSALRGAGIKVATNGGSGEQLADVQFLPDVRWLTQSYVAQQLGVSLPAKPTGPPAPGVHGHAMQSCSVAGNTLSTTTTNTLAASPAPQFTCTFTNDGTVTETNVIVKVTVEGTGVSGQTTVAQTVPGQQSTATIQLNGVPPTGPQTVTATVEHVPGETTFTHNSKTFQITFQ